MGGRKKGRMGLVRDRDGERERIWGPNIGLALTSGATLVPGLWPPNRSAIWGRDGEGERGRWRERGIATKRRARDDGDETLRHRKPVGCRIFNVPTSATWSASIRRSTDERQLHLWLNGGLVSLLRLTPSPRVRETASRTAAHEAQHQTWRRPTPRNLTPTEHPHIDSHQLPNRNLFFCQYLRPAQPCPAHPILTTSLSTITRL